MREHNKKNIVLIPHPTLSVDVYIELALELAQSKKYETRLLVLSEADEDKARKEGIPENHVISFEYSKRCGNLNDFTLEDFAHKYPSVPWGTVVAGERMFTDYSFTFGGTRCRQEKNDYVVPLIRDLIFWYKSLESNDLPSVLLCPERFKYINSNVSRVTADRVIA